MKLSITVNLGNYENVCIESSEHDSIDACRDEILEAQRLFRDPAIEEYLRKVFR